MQYQGKTETHHRRAWRPGIAAIAIAALAISGCGEDSEQTSPLAPTAIGDTAGPLASAAGHEANGWAATPGPQVQEAANNLTTDEPSDGYTIEVNPADGAGRLTIYGDLPPGVTRGDLEARAAMMQREEVDARRNSNAAIMNFHWPERPGRIEITRTEVDYVNERYSITITMDPPSPRPNSKGVMEVDRTVGKTVGTQAIDPGLRNWSSNYIEHNGERHRFIPGWYTFWLWARNCNEHRCVTGPAERPEHRGQGHDATAFRAGAADD